MDESLWWLMDIVAPAILLVLLIWLVMRRRSNRNPETGEGTNPRTERATHDLYQEEEQRRREGTDDL
jgi:membrane protein implicated in regulation of membrane protease activity